uniref:ribonuclease H n=1 Tax=Astyanax mexicanus TaxID=7994 RepID=A0A3B1IGT4_ASTMX
MMAEAEKVVFIPLEENEAIWRSKDNQFLKIVISAEGQGQPQTVRMTHESLIDPTRFSWREEMLRQVPECLWSKHSTDIGLVKSAQPVRVDLKPGMKLPWKNQYPLKEEAVQGIGPEIEGLVKSAQPVRVDLKPGMKLPWKNQYPLKEEAVQGIGPEIEGLVKSAQPVRVDLKPGMKLPWKNQYPLKEEAVQGIGPEIEGLVKSAQPVRVDLKPGMKLPWKNQYPLKEEAVQGIGPEIEGLVKSAQPVRVDLKPGMKLPWKNQYPLKEEAVQGIGPEIEGLVKSAQPVRVDLKPGMKLPWKNQYPLKEEAVQGIGPEIEGLVKSAQPVRVDLKPGMKLPWKNQYPLKEEAVQGIGPEIEGLVKSAQPVRVDLKPGMKLPWKNQYPLKEEAVQGIGPEIEGLVKSAQPVRVDLKPGMKLPWKNQYPLKEEAVQGIGPEIEGLVKSAQPVRVDLKPGMKLPWKNQYPLKEEAVQGIGPEIEGLVKAGVLKLLQNPQCNTPLLPVKKPDNSYRLVHDLRAVNEVVADFPAEVPDPHTLLAEIPPEASHFTVIDLCGAYFSVPLHEQSQGLFGFTYNGQSYVYTRIPQGYKHSPHVFNKILKDDLAGLQQLVHSRVLHYVDDLIVCSSSQEECHRDSIKLLQLLAEKGHKVSCKKLQYCQERVVYLGQTITKGHRSISDKQLEAIRAVPKPRTVREMMTFLGIVGYSSAWIEDYASLMGPLRAMIKDTGSAKLHCNLSWTHDGLLAFETIKQRMQEAPALALPDYSKNFLLYVSTSMGGKYACAVLSQPTGTGTGPQPISYYSTAYSEVELGLPLCYRAMVGVYLMYEKASAITMGYPVTILTHHSLRNLLNHGKYTLTMSRLRDYYRLLEQEDITLVRCATVNPAETLPTPEDGEPHECVQEAEKYSKLRADLQALPLQAAELELWTDGSCYRRGDKLCAGYAIVQAQGADFVVVKAEVIPQPASAQLAELVGLTEACLMADGKRVTIFTDSAFCHGICHLFGAVWKSRGFRKTDGSPIQHCDQIVKLLHAMMKPKDIAIVKCAAHKKDMSKVSRGNNAADEAAKAVIGANTSGEIFLVTHAVDLEDNVTLRDVALMQEAVPDVDKRLWQDRGATPDSTGLWRSHEGLIVAPSDLLGLMIHEAHGLGHVARGEVRRKITKEYGFWAPYLLEQIDHVIGRCTICLKNNVRRGVLVPPGYIPTPRGPMCELVVDFVDMIKPIGGKRYLLVVVDRFSRWVEACPTKKKDAHSVAKFLCTEVFSRWGLPDRLSSDNGKEFVDKTVKLILQKLGITQRFGSVYSPKSQGVCERMNGVLKKPCCENLSAHRIELG